MNHFEQTILLSIDRLDRRDLVDGLAYRLLLAAAWFAPGEPIPLLLRAMLCSSAKQIRFQAAMQRMLDTGLLLPVDAGAAMARLHRLVALGYLYRVRVEYDLALEYLRHALAIRQEIYATSSYIGMTRNHIERVYYFQGRYAQALVELDRGRFSDDRGRGWP